MLPFFFLLVLDFFLFISTKSIPYIELFVPILGPLMYILDLKLIVFYSLGDSGLSSPFGFFGGLFPLYTFLNFAKDIYKIVNKKTAFQTRKPFFRK